MFIVASAGGHHALIWGIALVVIGLVHLTFRNFYARRAAAVNAAQRATAPGFTKGFYRQHSARYYLMLNSAISAFFVLVGIVVIITQA